MSGGLSIDGSRASRSMPAILRLSRPSLRGGLRAPSRGAGPRRNLFMLRDEEQYTRAPLSVCSPGRSVRSDPGLVGDRRLYRAEIERAGRIHRRRQGTSSSCDRATVEPIPGAKPARGASSDVEDVWPPGRARSPPSATAPRHPCAAVGHPSAPRSITRRAAFRRPRAPTGSGYPRPVDCVGPRSSRRHLRGYAPRVGRDLVGASVTDPRGALGPPPTGFALSSSLPTAFRAGEDRRVNSSQRSARRRRCDHYLLRGRSPRATGGSCPRRRSSCIRVDSPGDGGRRSHLPSLGVLSWAAAAIRTLAVSKRGDGLHTAGARAAPPHYHVRAAGRHRVRWPASIAG